MLSIHCLYFCYNPYMNQYTAQSFWVSKKKGSIKKEPIKGLLEKDEIMVKTLYSGISYGTEKIVFDGQVPQNQYDFMRAPHQVGQFNSATKYGYLNIREGIDKK